MYNDVTRGTIVFFPTFKIRFGFSIQWILDAILARFDKYIGPILTNVFSKITDLDVIKQWNKNMTAPRRFLSQNRLVCDQIFAANNSLNQLSLKHGYPALHK